MTDSNAAVIAVDIGGTKILAGLVTREGSILHRLQAATPATPPLILAAVQALCSTLRQVAAEKQWSIHALGIASAGMVNHLQHEVIYANENIPGWTGTSFRKLPIANELPLASENDVRAMAYGEAILGAGADYEHVLCVTVGTGIGGAIILNKEIWHGATYSAGELAYLVIGWQDGEPVFLESCASGKAIERAYQQQMQAQKALALPQIAHRAYDGDSLARKIIEERASRLGQVLAGYVLSLSPQLVVIAGGVPQIGALWWQPLQSAFEALLPQSMRIALHASRFGAEAVIIGAAMLAWRKVKL